MSDYIDIMRLRLQDRQDRRSSFGPYLILNSVPWLFLASALRLFSRRWESVGSLYVLLILSQTVLLIAVLLAAARMIRLLGGQVTLSELSFQEQKSLTGRLAWKLVLVNFLAICLGFALGGDRNVLSHFWFGLDSTVYAWFAPDLFYFWNAFLVSVIFLTIVNKGIGKPPTLRSAVSEFFRRILFFGPALVLLVVFYSLSFYLQIKVFADALNLLYAALIDDTLKNFFNVGVVTFISYIRLWVTVAVLSYALRQSYIHDAR